MASRLVEINKPKLYYLRHLFAQQNKVKNVACSMIDNFIRIKNKDPNKGVKLYCLNGDISDGTFLMTVSLYSNYILYLQETIPYS